MPRNFIRLRRKHRPWPGMKALSQAASARFRPSAKDGFLRSRAVKDAAKKNHKVPRACPGGSIYMDNHATTPADPRVVKAMMPYFNEKFGNAASRTHSLGLESARAVEKARGQVARLVGADPREIVFTSGATESINLAIKGAAMAYHRKGNHIVTTVIEHKAGFDPCRRLETNGFRVTYVPVGSDGIVDPAQIRKALTDKTILISVMFANNEVGTIQPVAEIAKMARSRGVVFHCDAAQALGKVPIDVRAMGIDLLSVSAHKIYGPKGVGALCVRKSEPRVRLIPLFDGGGHEVGLRSGTLNVPGIVGFGVACGICRRTMAKESKRLGILRNRLRDGILNKVQGAYVNGSQGFRLANNLNMSFEGVSSEALIRGLRGVAVSSGSACLSTSAEPSYVLKAIGLPEALRGSSIRFGLGRFNTADEVDEVIRKVTAAVVKCRLCR